MDIDFPVIKQMTSSPVIYLTTPKRFPDLVCQCGNVLISNYIQDVFISVAIECNKCHQLTLTPELPYGEILPTGLGIHALENREHFINIPMFLPLTMVMTGSKTLLADQSMFNPVKLPLPPKSYKNFIEDIKMFYNTLTRGNLVKHTSSVNRSLRISEQPNAEYPLPWALYYVEKSINLSARRLNEDKNFVAAMHSLVSFHESICRWNHHPVFEEFGKVFNGRKSFHHNVFQLIAATILVQSGNRVGLAKALGNGTETPDMYVNFAQSGRFHIEVKAPEALQWASKSPITFDLVRKVISAKLKECQINSDNPGILVIGCTRFERIRDIEQMFKEIITKNGSSHKHLSGILLLQSKSITVDKKNSNDFLLRRINISKLFIVNKYYYEYNPFGSVAAQ